MPLPQNEIAALAAASASAVQSGARWDDIVFAALAAMCDADPEAVRAVRRVSGPFPQRYKRRASP